MDMVYSAPMHFDPQLFTDIVDEAWAADKLPVEDIQVPPTAMANIDDDDPTAQREEDDELKWNDLGLEELSSTAPQPAAQSSAHTNDTSTPRNASRP